ncbi:GNAT family N-acetyltransferase [Dongia soli]|uniref:GNAT family N-acetyltransferase n=1 Tax=Dongia soli TaxID=600628 RepID=A0ABU5E7Z5_9PROT|nr:GNAT family N-acetyltransferase [Dongia soli]MDY0882407.1 GNAT family N-acetyltransferase [Dongia soli]
MTRLTVIAGSGTDNCRLRSARPREAAALTDLALLSKASWGYDAAFMARCRKVMTISPEDIRRHPYYVAEDSRDRLTGFYGFAVIDGLLNLDWLFVMPDQQRRGIGTHLFRHAITLARGLGFAYFQITSDPHAEDFYRRQGAVVAGAVPSDLSPARYLPLLRFDLTELARQPQSR